MGLFDGVFGGIVGAGMVSVVSDIIDKHGGLNGVVNQFQQQGFGDTVRSWVSTGQNQPISPDEIHKVLGSDTMNQLAAKLGMTPQELAAKLSTVLPQAIDRLTPAGVVPPVTSHLVTPRGRSKSPFVVWRVPRNSGWFPRNRSSES